MAGKKVTITFDPSDPASVGEALDQVNEHARKFSVVPAVRFGDRVMQVRELPMATITKIARENSTVTRPINVFEVAITPFVDGGVAEAIVREVANYIGPDAVVPEPLTFQAVQDLFDTVPDDVPEEKGEKSDPTGAAT